MEIPILGRLLRRNKPSPETVNAPQPQEPVQPKLEPQPATEVISDAPDVDREEVRKQLARSRRIKSVMGEDFDRRAKEAVREDIKEATPELLEELARTLDPDERNFKFLREGERIIVAGHGAHADYANEAHMVPEDGGFIARDKDRLNDQLLLIEDGSGGLRILPGNKNRPRTLEILRQMVPNVTFEERTTKRGEDLISMFGKREQSPRPRRSR